QFTVGVARLDEEIIGRDAVVVFVFRPQSAWGRAFGVTIVLVLFLFLRRIVLLFRIELVAVRFVVPPDHAGVGSDYGLAGVHVADHALRGRDAARQGVLDRMTRFVARDGRVARLRVGGVA